MSSEVYAAGWDEQSVEDLESLVAPLSNWGRWGAQDELGTANLLTAELVAASAREVRTGETVALGRRLAPHMSSDGRGVLHHMTSTPHVPARRGGSHAGDWLALSFHGFSVTHLDAPSHQHWSGRMYNGRASSLVTTSGARANAVGPYARGLVGRGVLLDAARVLGGGVDWLEPGRALGPEELDRVSQGCDVEVRPGDLVLVRVGRDALAASVGDTDPLVSGTAGLSASSLIWLSAHDVAVLGSDVATDAMRPGGMPHPMPVHAGALVFLGLPLLDNLWLEDLAVRCAAQGCWSFQLVVSPLPIERATGSPVNPIAVL